MAEKCDLLDSIAAYISQNPQITSLHLHNINVDGPNWKKLIQTDMKCLHHIKISDDNYQRVNVSQWPNQQRNVLEYLWKRMAFSQRFAAQLQHFAVEGVQISEIFYEVQKVCRYATTSCKIEIHGKICEDEIKCIDDQQEVLMFLKKKAFEQVDLSLNIKLKVSKVETGFFGG